MTGREAGPAGEVRAAAADVFGARLVVAEQFVAALRARGVTLGLVGPRELDRLWERHLLNCALVTELVESSATVTDVGSGAGFPGLVMAMRRPDLRLTLIESMGRRASWLEEMARDLELMNVRVYRGRAQDARDMAVADVVTARAVAPLTRLLELTWPLCRPGGLVLALKGEQAEREIDDARAWLSRSGVSEVRVETLSSGMPWSARIVVVRKPVHGRTGRPAGGDHTARRRRAGPR